MKLLCWLGWHKWGEWRKMGMGNYYKMKRMCSKCGIVRVSNTIYDRFLD